MVKKGSKSSGRRSSLVATTEPDNITVVDGTNNDHSKFSVARSNLAEPTKDIQHWAELKSDCQSTQEIRNKVRRLPLDNVLPLLVELLAEFNVQQARDTELTEWIKTVLLIHTAYFMTLPDVVQRLSTLYKELDDRLTVYPKLLAMHGRLDLIQSQIDARNRKEEEESEEEESEDDAQSFSESEDDIDEEEEDNDNEDDNLMDMDHDDEEAEMFAEEEDDLNTEDEDDNISDSDIEE